MKAKATAIILAAAFILTMTGCGKTDAPSEGSAASTESLMEASAIESTIESTGEDLSFLDGEVVGSVIVLNDGRGLLLYSGSYENGREYAATLGEYKNRLGENVNVYSLVIPTAAAFYLPEKYYDEGVAAREPPRIDDIKANLSGVIPIDVYSALESHVLNGEEQIYFKTDMHWTHLGAYYAAEKFAETALVPFDSLDNLASYDKKERSTFTGNLTAAINESHTRAKSEPFTWYEPKREVTTTTLGGREKSYFANPGTIGGDFYMVFDGARSHTSTGLETGRRLMIVGDSFAWAAAPWLFGSFDDVWMIDCRGLDDGESITGLAEENGITDLLFCSSISVATTDSQKMFSEIM